MCRRFPIENDLLQRKKNGFWEENENHILVLGTEEQNSIYPFSPKAMETETPPFYIYKFQDPRLSDIDASYVEEQWQNIYVQIYKICGQEPKYIGTKCKKIGNTYFLVFEKKPQSLVPLLEQKLIHNDGLIPENICPASSLMSI